MSDNNHNRRKRKEPDHDSEDEDLDLNGSLAGMTVEPPKKKRKKSKAHKGGDLQEPNHKLVKLRIEENPGQTLRDSGDGYVECQACGKEMKPDKTTIKRHLGLSSVLC